MHVKRRAAKLFIRTANDAFTVSLACDERGVPHEANGLPIYPDAAEQAAYTHHNAVYAKADWEVMQ